jgi:hypothetical protein
MKVQQDSRVEVVEHMGIRDNGDKGRVFSSIADKVLFDCVVCTMSFVLPLFNRITFIVYVTHYEAQLAAPY